MDYLPGLDSDEKKLRLSRISYEAFLRELVKVEPSVLHFYHARTMGEWGVGTDAVSALAGYEDTGGSLRLHFPDGNATIAHSLVRDLIPAALPGRGVGNLITARVDYA